METLMRIAPYLAVFLGIAAVLVLVLRRKRAKIQSEYDVTALYEALGKENIVEVEYLRGKVNAKLRDPSNADLNAVKAAGASGVNVVGDKVKLYFEDDNEKICAALKAMVENRGEST